MSATAGVQAYCPWPNGRPAQYNFGFIPQRIMMGRQLPIGVRSGARCAFYRSRSEEALYKPPNHRVPHPARPKSAQEERKKDLRRSISAPRRCKVCHKTLATGGFFMHEEAFYCAEDYQELFGVRCHGCGEFVEGDVVTALGQTYHQQCFVCAQCGKPFPPGEQVTQQGENCLCEICVASHSEMESRICAGCHGEIKSGQALLAIDQQWHLWCFKCHLCEGLLAGEFMARDGRPYCERDYHLLFGVKCAACGEYILGKVFQAGDSHYHPDCSRCCVCGQPFGAGEDMYTLNGSVWHPYCDKSKKQSPQKSPPAGENIAHCNGFSYSDQQTLERKMPTRADSEGQTPTGGDSAISCNTPSSPERTEHYRCDSERKSDCRPASSSSMTSISSASSPELSMSPSYSTVASRSERATSSHATDGSQAQEKRNGFDWRSRYSIDEGFGDITGVKRSSLHRSLSGDTSLASGVSSSRSQSHPRVHQTRSSPTNELQKSNVSSSSWRRASLGSESRRRHSNGKDNRHNQPVTEVYPLEVLQQRGSHHLPKDIDRTHLEDYLSEQDFQKAFDMTHTEFKKLQVWRQRDLKKRAKLF